MIETTTCVVLRCDQCKTYVYQDDGIPHYKDAETARLEASHVEWTRDGDRDLCEWCRCEKDGHRWGETFTSESLGKDVQFCWQCTAHRDASQTEGASS